MSLRVAFDLDGTVADMQWALRREAERLFGPAAVGPTHPDGPSPDAESVSIADSSVNGLTLTATERTRLWNHVQRIENFWTTLPELEPGIIARISHTATTRRWEVLFITTRPPTAGEPTQLQSQRWLHAHGFQFPSVYVVQRLRGKLAAALHLDAVVDDRPENCLDVAIESKARVILVWNGPMTDMLAGARRLGVHPVATITEALSVLEQLDDSRRQSRVTRSLRRILGRGRTPRQR